MIYQKHMPLMIVGYLILILMSSGVNAAPGDINPKISPTQASVTPNALNAVNTGAMSAGDSRANNSIDTPKSGSENTDTSNTAAENLDTPPEQSSQIQPATLPVEAAVGSDSTGAETPEVESAEQQTPVNSQNINTPMAEGADTPAIQSNVMSVKPVAGLDIPEKGQSKIVPTSQASDVRVIIDISGSMKENDSENVRIPALNLIVEMLPDGARAGVWTFGQWVNMLIAPAKVDSAWRENAKLQAKKINSHGLRTNIGEAMEKAIWKFEKDNEFDQHIILLTDGLVDIAQDSDPKKQQKDEAERQRILTKVLKKYKQLGVKIHTIALSDKADKGLLQRLALETNGTSEVVNNSADLVKAFLKAFDQAAPEVAEQVPLSPDNTFKIDASIQEFTALVFRKKGSAPTQFISPSGKTISQIKASDNAKWYSESLYDLVTLTTPEAGQWKIEADLDPDNRVTVVSDLKMEIANLPTTLFPGQQVDFEVYLHENGKVLTEPDFLKLMTIQMTMTAESGRSGTKNISDPNNIPTNGRYTESIKKLSKEGQYELKVSVDGKTFQRMKKELIQVRQPIGFEIHTRMVNGVKAYAVRVVPQIPDIEVSRTRVIAKLKSPDGSSIIQAMPWIEEGVWEAVIDSNKGPGEYKIAMNIKGLFAKDQEFRVKPDPISLFFPIPADFTHKYYVKDDKQDVIAETESELPGEPVMPDLADKMKEQENNVNTADKQEKPAEESPDVKAGESDASEATEETSEEEDVAPIPSWIFILIPILAILLGVGGYFAYRLISKKKGAATNKTPDAPQTKDSEEPPVDVSLNDGMDGENFDEDFDLSDSDEDEELLSDSGDIDALNDLDLSNDDDINALEDLDEIPDLDEPELEMDEPPIGDTGSEEVKDEIPDFDENFNIDADADTEEVEPVADAKSKDAAAALLDSVLDDLDDVQEDIIPQLEESEPEAPAEEVKETLNEDLAGEAAVDAALANLESELEDLDLDENK